MTFNFGPVNVNELDANQPGFKVSPNPTEGILSVEIAETWKENTTELVLFSATGEKLLHLQWSEHQGQLI